MPPFARSSTLPVRRLVPSGPDQTNVNQIAQILNQAITTANAGINLKTSQIQGETAEIKRGAAEERAETQLTLFDIESDTQRTKERTAVANRNIKQAQAEHKWLDEKELSVINNTYTTRGDLDSMKVRPANQAYHNSVRGMGAARQSMDRMNDDSFPYFLTEGDGKDLPFREAVVVYVNTYAEETDLNYRAGMINGLFQINGKQGGKLAAARMDENAAKLEQGIPLAVDQAFTNLIDMTLGTKGEYVNTLDVSVTIATDSMSDFYDELEQAYDAAKGAGPLAGRNPRQVRDLFLETVAEAYQQRGLAKIPGEIIGVLNSNMGRRDKYRHTMSMLGTSARDIEKLSDLFKKEKFGGHVGDDGKRRMSPHGDVLIGALTQRRSKMVESTLAQVFGDTTNPDDLYLSKQILLNHTASSAHPNIYKAANRELNAQVGAARQAHKDRFDQIFRILKENFTMLDAATLLANMDGTEAAISQLQAMGVLSTDEEIMQRAFAMGGGSVAFTKLRLGQAVGIRAALLKGDGSAGWINEKFTDNTGEKVNLHDRGEWDEKHVKLISMIKTANELPMQMDQVKDALKLGKMVPNVEYTDEALVSVFKNLSTFNRLQKYEDHGQFVSDIESDAQLLAQYVKTFGINRIPPQLTQDLLITEGSTPQDFERYVITMEKLKAVTGSDTMLEYRMEPFGATVSMIYRGAKDVASSGNILRVIQGFNPNDTEVLNAQWDKFEREKFGYFGDSAEKAEGLWHYSFIKRILDAKEMGKEFIAEDAYELASQFVKSTMKRSYQKIDFGGVGINVPREMFVEGKRFDINTYGGERFGKLLKTDLRHKMFDMINDADYQDAVDPVSGLTYEQLDAIDIDDMYPNMSQIRRESVVGKNGKVSYEWVIPMMADRPESGTGFFGGIFGVEYLPELQNRHIIDLRIPYYPSKWMADLEQRIITDPTSMQWRTYPTVLDRSMLGK